MWDKIIEKFKNKSIAILGFGREGLSTYKFLRKYLDEKITILDKNESIKENPIFKEDSNVSFVLGNSYMDNLNDYDIIVKSSGISLNHMDNSSFIQKIVSQYSLLLEDTDLFVIGITGTKGKSTTSTLLYEVIKDQNDNTILMGNIGIPFFDMLDKINKDTILVTELSAYQLELIKKAPHISILLNLYEEHLDYFGSKEKYFNSKLNILKKQSSSDFGFYLKDNKDYIKDIKSTLYEVGSDICIKDDFIYFKDEKLYNINDKRNLLGNHNLTNIMFVLGVCKLLNLDIDKCIKVINNFKGLEHRMEYVGTYFDIKFYNDTIATIPTATINAIETLKDVDTLIFGGMDRGIDYTALIEYLEKSNINNLICMPETGTKIGNILKENTNKNIYFTDDMKEAVLLAKEHTKKGMICLLSPSAPSYNKYKNFEEKGKDYKDIIKSL